MRTIKLLLTLLLVASQSALAFNQKTDTVIVTNDSCGIVQFMFIVTIDNTDNEALWIWLDNNDYGHDYRKAIRRYLMKRRGDFSIFDIGADPNMMRALKNYRYFHFIGVFRRHYRAFTRRSGYDVW